MSGVLKIIASAVVVLGGGYIGILAAAELETRVRQIEELLGALSQIGFNISFLKMPLSRAIRGVADGQRGAVGGLLGSVAKQIAEDGVSPDTAFERAIRKSRGSLCIGKGEIEILSEFTKNLGRGDTESEINNINLACAKLTLARDNARGELSQKGKLWRGMGLLGGMLVVVLLF